MNTDRDLQIVESKIRFILKKNIAWPGSKWYERSEMNTDRDLQIGRSFFKNIKLN